MPKRRYEITDEQWQRIEHLLPGKPGDPGRTAEDNRRFINAVLWIARTGAPWPDLPERFGKYNSVSNALTDGQKRASGSRSLNSCKNPTWSG